MNLDSYLVEMLDEYIEVFFSESYLKQLWATWSKMRNEKSSPFEDFVYGNLNGAITTLYSSYHGKRVLELNDEEFKELKTLLDARYSGVENKIKKFQSENKDQQA